MSFSADFSSGIVICDECNNPIMTHVDCLLNKNPENSLNLLNKECFKSAQEFLKSWHMVKCSSEIGKAGSSRYYDDYDDEEDLLCFCCDNLHERCTCMDKE